MKMTPKPKIEIVTRLYKGLSLLQQTSIRMERYVIWSNQKAVFYRDLEMVQGVLHSIEMHPEKIIINYQEV